MTHLVPWQEPQCLREAEKKYTRDLVKQAFREPESALWRAFGCRAPGHPGYSGYSNGPAFIAETLVGCSRAVRNRVLKVLMRRTNVLRAFATASPNRRRRTCWIDVNQSMLRHYLRLPATGVFLAAWLDRQGVGLRCDAVVDEMTRMVVRSLKGTDNPLWREGMTVWLGWLSEAHDRQNDSGRAPDRTDRRTTKAAERTRRAKSSLSSSCLPLGLPDPPGADSSAA
jgi:hypothetical protein